MLNMFKDFLADENAACMYITGVAGTGKTTSLSELLTFCYDEKIKAIATAYTHKACSVLRTKLPKEAVISTLHSFLSKRPTINDKALIVTHVNGNTSAGAIEEVDVLFIDEFSMVGEKDYLDISDLQYDDEGNVKVKVVYIGDPNQLPPVRDIKAIEPGGKYWYKLTHIYRQANGNPLIDNLIALNDYINGEEPQALVEHENLLRGVDIAKLYKQDRQSKILLAYTNAQVEHLNATIQGRLYPIEGDALFSPTIRQHYTLVEVAKDCNAILTYTDKLLELNSKYKTLEAIHNIEGVGFYYVTDTKGNEEPRAAVFGHARYLEVQQSLASKAVFINKQIMSEFNEDPKEWSKNNWQHPTAKARGKAWASYLSFKDCVMCLDFAHAMTVHKSQGSTYENVYIDTEDLSRCADKDYIMYLKLLYVAISRASNKVFTN